MTRPLMQVSRRFIWFPVCGILVGLFGSSVFAACRRRHQFSGRKLAAATKIHVIDSIGFGCLDNRRREGRKNAIYNAFGIVHYS